MGKDNLLQKSILDARQQLLMLWLWCLWCGLFIFFFRAKLSNRTVRMGRFYSALFSAVAPNHKWSIRNMAGETEKLNILFHFITIWKNPLIKWSIVDVDNLATKQQQGGSVLSRVWVCKPMDCSPPGFSVHGLSQARILEWVAIFFSISSRPWNRTGVSYIAGGFFISWVTREAPRGTVEWIGTIVSILRNYLRSVNICHTVTWLVSPEPTCTCAVLFPIQQSTVFSKRLHWK